jgi:paraquat-inducible protein B
MLNNLQAWFSDFQEDVDIGGISKKLNNVLEALDDLARSEDMNGTLAGINRLLNDDEMREISGNVNTMLEEMREASAAASNLFNSTNEDVDMLVADLQPSLRRLAGALDEAEQTLNAAKLQLKGDSEQAYRLGAALDEFGRASRAVREFFDYMERNPEAVWRGKPE